MTEVWLRRDEGLDLYTLGELVKLEQKEIRVHRIGKSTLRVVPNGPVLVEKERKNNVVAIRPNR